MPSDNLFPVLPLRDVVVFPHMVVPLMVGRDKSMRALEAVMPKGKELLLVTQKDAGTDDPTLDDLHAVGTIGTVVQLLKLPDRTAKVLVEGSRRARIVGCVKTEKFIEVEARFIEQKFEEPMELEALARMVNSQFEKYAKLNLKISPDAVVSLNQIEDPSKLADSLAVQLALGVPDKQAFLEIISVGERLERAYGLMESEIGVRRLEKRLRGRVKGQVERNQREYFLHETLRAIEKEIGDTEDGGDEGSELQTRIDEIKLSPEAREKALHELKKFRSMSPMSPEASVVRNYLDWLLAVPWRKRSRVTRDIERAERILDEDHYGLVSVKARIVEFLAVQKRVGKAKGPILCLVGPPGVGKTSIGKSIARATGRKFVRMSLGGIRDEAEIRGHRRTYIGARPGKIIQGMKKAKTSNPLFLLDEVDKLGADWRGDPSSALLEVLDPEQNSAFNDHYLDIDYDLSDVMFVTTANTLRMPEPLVDRMEIIRLPGYTEDEKIQIAKRHLIPELLMSHGMRAHEWSISDEALRNLIRHYTREAGVRNLKREIATLMRKAVMEVMLSKREIARVTRRNLERWAGVERFRSNDIGKRDLVGVGTALAWTEAGGELLSVETVVMHGTGGVSHTGNLGLVMRESVQAARSFVRSRAADFGIAPTLFETRDIHVHVPDGATPKDGPSAGIAMCASIVSALTAIPVRKDIAMTGEITLHGQVLPVEGLKEKLLAAVRSRVAKVLIPRGNEQDLEEVPRNIRRALDIVSVSSVDDAVRHALSAAPKLIVPVEADVESVQNPSVESDASGSVPH